MGVPAGLPGGENGQGRESGRQQSCLLRRIMGCAALDHEATLGVDIAGF